ncbi:prepilin peptidase [Actinomadura flavalba]|uniref:prepilin peptidase n=1 Tax=Actinomadura flavalba TaxID=1120938 RepID=UPI00035FDBBD|nr:A24 family peptidase [Actinomadura flavalba]
MTPPDWAEPLRRRPWTVLAGCALAAAVLGARVGAVPELPAVLYLAVAGVVLTVVDLALHRLPDAITLPSYGVAGALLAVAALADGDGARLAHALAGAAAFGLLFFVQWFVLPDALGFGDVKLAGVLGLYLGWYGLAAFWTGALVTFAAGGLVAVVLLAARRASRKDALPYGPFLVLGTFAAVLLHA